MANNNVLILGGLGAIGMLWVTWKRGKELSTENLENVLQWYGIAQFHAEKNGVPVEAILAIIWQESSGNPDAGHASGEVGLMGLKAIAVQDVGYLEPSKRPEINIKQGTEFFAFLKSLTKDETDALRAYNQTGSNVSRLRDSSLGLAYARGVQRKKQVIATELNKLSFTDELAIGANFGASGIVQTIGQKVSDFFNEFF